MNNPLRLFLKILFALALGTVGSLLYLSRDQRCIDALYHKITVMLERDYGLHFTGTVSSLSLLGASVTFKDVTVHSLSHHENWAVKIKKSTISLLPLRSLVTRKLGMKIELEGSSIFSEIVEQKILLFEVLKKFFIKPARLSLYCEHCECIDTRVHFLEKEGEREISTLFDIVIDHGQDTYHGTCRVKEGSLTFSHKKVMTDLSGPITFIFPEVISAGFSVEPNLSCKVPLFFKADEKCHITGKWEKSGGLFRCWSDAQSLQRATVQIKEQKDHTFFIQSSGVLSLSACMHALKFSSLVPAVGTVAFDMEGVVGTSLQGSLILEGSRLAGWSIDFLKTSFEWTPESLKGSLVYAQKNEQLTGEWGWDSSVQQIRFSLTNTTPFSLFATKWYLPEKQTVVKGTWSPSLEGIIKYQLSCEQQKTERLFKSHGTIHWKGSDFLAQGAVLAGDSLYHWHAVNSPFVLTVLDENKEETAPMVKIGHDQSRTTARVDLSLLQNILREYAQIAFVGKGALEMQGVWHGSELQGSLALKEGMIRFPSVYNFIHTLQTQFACNFLKRNLSFLQVKIALQKGTIESAALRIGYDPLAHGIWAHLPLIFTDCFINWNKDLYLLFSGAFIAKKTPEKRLVVDSFVVLDRSQLKENIFSQKTQRLLLDAWSNPMAEKKVDASLSISTRSPLSVKTEQLETQALLELLLKSGGDQTELEGTITLQRGALHFPAHSLSIVKGKIIFTPEQTQDPFLELTAQARIKKYLITLSIGGTAQDPHLVFDSIPSLSEEQIMMLLIAGSEEESLNIVVPALIMRNVENVIFGSSYRSRHDSWLEPLKRIKFVPRFTDQTGRGGFRGALEIEVSKRLRAIIEKNFSLTEDVAFEVEYLLTDDVSVRASYDERGDVGAEMEMRFKF
jgi:hypothetical protein